MKYIENEFYHVEIQGESEKFMTYKINSTNTELNITAPSFEIDSEVVKLSICDIKEVCNPRILRNGCVEYRLEGIVEQDTSLSLEVIIHTAKDNPVVRFRYIIKGDKTHILTKSSGKDEIVYLATHLNGSSKVKEVRLSEFIPMVHSYCPCEQEIDSRYFDNEMAFMGPILIETGERESMLVAYEHGSQAPDKFIEFVPCNNGKIAIRAVKGNYYAGQVIDKNESYSTVWFNICALKGSEENLAKAYRTFVLKYMSLNTESRKPYIFYNTWGMQERARWLENKSCHTPMELGRILQEIDAAHCMGVDVFVLDAGWYDKPGDWEVNKDRFPDGLKTIKEKLDSYGMKLGLWLAPTYAALSSNISRNNEDCIMSFNDAKKEPVPVMAGEENCNIMCLASKFSTDFIDNVLKLLKKTGASYLKWDGTGQYGCNNPGHMHGTEENSNEERADCYSFMSGIQMCRIADKICEQFPDTIIDFDITETHRYVGLGFLSSGKYFLINNGPYYVNYDHPKNPEKWSNIFIYPGTARGWVCRTPLSYDRWIPSILFLTHYMPDDPKESQMINLASLVLGQNGLWGNLLNVSEEGLNLIHNVIKLYKQVRDDISESYPVRSNIVGGSTEVHEKISETTGCGAVCIFSNEKGSFTYVTYNIPYQKTWSSEGVKIERDRKGRAVITAEFTKPSAAIAFFGVN